MNEITLKEILELISGPIIVYVKEPNKGIIGRTTLKDGKSNIHTDKDLSRHIYMIGTGYDQRFNNPILKVFCW